MKKFRLLLFISILFFTSCQKSEESKLNIAVAANMQFAMKEIIKEFKEQTGIECQMMTSSSGKLNAQIKEGAPYHIFVSANMKYPQDLFDAGFTTSNPEIYAYGKLVLWSMKEGVLPSIELLQKVQINHIAIANPKTAPYGTAAKEVLMNLNLYKDLESKLVYGESVAQCNQFILSKSAEMGFTAKSVVLSMHGKDQGQWIDVEDSLYSPITQGAVIIKQNEMHAEAKEFYEFLFSDRAALILEGFGYQVSVAQDWLGIIQESKLSSEKDKLAVLLEEATELTKIVLKAKD
ncbi:MULTISPECIES: molybdate ABC transporter substrate-binding protein [unclassified Lentimicrobium]|uniref:molybdate ABC transporter substrate-binding protein n=1 Tax=unclassified Lentimicrobium TaxID=2677434 RepID=UPI0015526C5E|nr:MULTISPECIES: molybdate ABC transporter substrate-binding protein [unclassified Lentimicrobium]NPD44617.1 molybdate ABC transporter substrate-binding protein [Lentimicrobium sp. S6]NPD83329.1 molybdate ABC transporter substrate-binding protein [Lentimicrobium sp. L6]